MSVELKTRGRKMKKEIIYYKKCLCCGKKGGYVFRSKGSSIEDYDVHCLISDAIQGDPNPEWCNYCQMMTKQEEVAWDYVDGKTPNIPDEEFYQCEEE